MFKRILISMTCLALTPMSALHAQDFYQMYPTPTEIRQPWLQTVPSGDLANPFRTLIGAIGLAQPAQAAADGPRGVAPMADDSIPGWPKPLAPGGAEVP